MCGRAARRYAQLLYQRGVPSLYSGAAALGQRMTENDLSGGGRSWAFPVQTVCATRAEHHKARARVVRTHGSERSSPRHATATRARQPLTEPHLELEGRGQG